MAPYDTQFEQTIERLAGREEISTSTLAARVAAATLRPAQSARTASSAGARAAKSVSISATCHE